MRRRVAPRRNAVVLLLVIFMLVIVFGFIDHQVHQTPPSKFLVPPPNRFRVTEDPHTWHGQPVYRIENITKMTLERVVPGSWSEQVIPVLYEGAALPRRLNAIHPNLNPPFNLKPGESLWIVSSLQTPYQMTVIWMVNGRDRYQVYEIPPQ